MDTKVHEFTTSQKLMLWWEVTGELYHDLLVYYVWCGIWGFCTGYGMGKLLLAGIDHLGWIVP